MNLDAHPVDQLLLRRKQLRRQLSAVSGLQPVRIAVLGGSTTNELVDLLELLLLASGFLPTFRQSDYGRFYEEAVHDPDRLIEFAPDIVYLHTSHHDVQARPSFQCSEAELDAAVDLELARYTRLWEALEQRLSAQIIQNNFELPPIAPLGNLDAVSSGGSERYFLRLNLAFARVAASKPRLVLQDVLGLSARVGLDRWFDSDRWFSYKILTTPEANLVLARSLASIVRAMYGKSKKVLVLDLDNTLWGGVIGDDGVDRIQIGRETPLAEAYTAFQQYCLSLQRRGVLLAVCSKNNEETAKQGFAHPDSVLRLEDISCFKANWEPKHETILAIARELNLGVESFVFVDDNPAERALVEAQLSGVSVPDIGSDVSRFAAILEAGRYFETVSMSAEDFSRAALYQADFARVSQQEQFATYSEYLDSLAMCAEIGRFKPVYLDRIAQLVNKTNQFNLTTRRYTRAELEDISRDQRWIPIYGRLRDRFGDNGLVSVVLGKREHDVLHIELWLMSCRILKRDMELAMLDTLVTYARAAQVSSLQGHYIPTNKNSMVADHYSKLGFEPVEATMEQGASSWRLDIAAYESRNRHIIVMES